MRGGGEEGMGEENKEARWKPREGQGGPISLAYVIVPPPPLLFHPPPPSPRTWIKGDTNSEARKQTPTVTATRPVRPPSLMPT